MKNYTLILLFVIVFSFEGNTQTPTSSTDIGLLIGESYYLGELNTKHFTPFNLAIGGFYRYNYNDRLALKFAFNYGKINGEDKNSNNSYSELRQLNFYSNIYEFSINGEFNFLEFSHLNDKTSPLSPYVFLGIGYFMHAPKSDDGTKTDLQTQETEGIQYKRLQASIPLGLGIKYHTGKFGIGLEWGIRKTFTDYLDDVSSNYENGQVTLPDNTNLNVTNIQRGEIYTKDWFVFTGVTLFINLTSKRYCP